MTLAALMVHRKAEQRAGLSAVLLGLERAVLSVILTAALRAVLRAALKAETSVDVMAV